MTNLSQTTTNKRNTRSTVATLSVILSTAILTVGGSLGLATSAQAHHGGSHSIEVDQSGQAYEVLGPNWHNLIAPVAIAGGLSLLGLGNYFINKKQKAE